MLFGPFHSDGCLTQCAIEPTVPILKQNREGSFFFPHLHQLSLTFHLFYSARCSNGAKLFSAH